MFGLHIGNLADGSSFSGWFEAYNEWASKFKAAMASSCEGLESKQPVEGAPTIIPATMPDIPEDPFTSIMRLLRADEKQGLKSALDLRTAASFARAPGAAVVQALQAACGALDIVAWLVFPEADRVHVMCGKNVGQDSIDGNTYADNVRKLLATLPPRVNAIVIASPSTYSHICEWSDRTFSLGADFQSFARTSNLLKVSITAPICLTSADKIVKFLPRAKDLELVVFSDGGWRPTEQQAAALASLTSATAADDEELFFRFSIDQVTLWKPCISPSVHSFKLSSVFADGRADDRGYIAIDLAALTPAAEQLTSLRLLHTFIHNRDALVKLTSLQSLHTQAPRAEWRPAVAAQAAHLGHLRILSSLRKLEELLLPATYCSSEEWEVLASLPLHTLHMAAIQLGSTPSTSITSISIFMPGEYPWLSYMLPELRQVWLGTYHDTAVRPLLVSVRPCEKVEVLVLETNQSCNAWFVDYEMPELALALLARNSRCRQTLREVVLTVRAYQLRLPMAELCQLLVPDMVALRKVRCVMSLRVMPRTEEKVGEYEQSMPARVWCFLKLYDASEAWQRCKVTGCVRRPTAEPRDWLLEVTLQRG